MQDTTHSVPRRCPRQQGAGSSASQGLSPCPGRQRCRYDGVLFPDAASFCSSPAGSGTRGGETDPYITGRSCRGGRAGISPTPEPACRWKLPSQEFLGISPVFQHNFPPSPTAACPFYSYGN